MGVVGLKPSLSPRNVGRGPSLSLPRDPHYSGFLKFRKLPEGLKMHLLGDIPMLKTFSFRGTLPPDP